MKEANESREARQAAMLTALDASIEPRRSSLAYRLSLALATLVVLALPLVYVALAVGVGGGMVWAARKGEFGLAIMAGAVVLLLSKALFARPARIVRPHRLEPEEQPFLFEFVGRLSQRLRAPAPRRIYVNLDVNASASFLWGAGLVHDDLALTIGLPLVSCTDLGQFTAVLAHEFGHFSQGTAMRSGALSAAVNRWFARVVYRRDALDLALDKLARATSYSLYTWGFMLIFLGARGCIWLTRRLLYSLMKLSSWITALLARQMEFDADQNAVRLCGSETFVSFMRQLPVIEASSGWAARVNESQLRQGTLSDDYPELVRHCRGEVTDEVRRSIIEQAMSRTAGMYASHPPAGERIARAEALGTVGRFTSQAPASVLFRDYSTLCRELTASRYQIELGKAFDPRLLVPTEAAFASLRSRRQASGLANTYFHGLTLGPASFGLDHLEIGPPARAQEALDALAEALRQSSELAVGAKAACKRLDALEDGLRLVTAARCLRDHLLPLKDEQLAPLRKCDDLKGEGQRQVAEIDVAHDELEAFAASMRTRIQCALGLLQVPSIRARMEDPDTLFERGRAALRALVDLREPAFQAREAVRTTAVVGFLFGGKHDWDDDERTRGALERTQRDVLLELNARLRALHRSLEGKRYRFAAGKDPTDLQEFCFQRLPNRAPEPTFEAARRTLGTWLQLVGCILGEIAEVGTAVETAVSSSSDRAASEITSGS